MRHYSLTCKSVNISCILSDCVCGIALTQNELLSLKAFFFSNSLLP